MTSNRKGFTLVELLVVIGIIGILATVVTLSLADARAKGRDAKRLSDITEIGKGLEIADTETPLQPLGGCITQGSLTTSCTSPATIPWATAKDPIGTAACHNTGTTTPCQYTIGVANPTSENYEICFYMESKSNLGDKGVYRKTPAGIVAGCTN